MSATLELYGAAGCPFTAELREQLEWEGKQFVEYDIERDPDAKRRLIELTGARMVPALIEQGRVVSIGWRGRGCAV